MEIIISSMQMTVYKIKSKFYNNLLRCKRKNVWLNKQKINFYSVLYIQDALEGPNINRRVFLDPNTLSADGTVALTGTQSFSRDGELFAYGLSTSGSDWRKVYFFNVTSNQTLDDVLIKVKFTDIVWKGNEGIFYGVSSFLLQFFFSLFLRNTTFHSITQILRAIHKDLTQGRMKIRKSVSTNWEHLKTMISWLLSFLINQKI